MAAKKPAAAAAPKRKKVLLAHEPYWTYRRLSAFIFLPASEMVRKETVLLALVAKKLARMTRCDGVLKFQLVEHGFDVELLASPDDPPTTPPLPDAPAKSARAAKPANAKQSQAKPANAGQEALLKAMAAIKKGKK